MPQAPAARYFLIGPLLDTRQLDHFLLCIGKDGKSRMKPFQEIVIPNPLLGIFHLFGILQAVGVKSFGI